MKRIFVVFLCLCMILTGCHKGTKQNDTNESDITATPTQIPTPQAETMTDKLLKLNSEWSLVQSLVDLEVDYEAPIAEAKVAPYTIESDLSNIENIDQFSGFTEEQTDMLAENGFVVVPAINTRIYYTYDDNEYKGVPNFITSDSALHLYHQFYDKSLMCIEMNGLYQDLDQMTEQMLEKSILLMQELTDEDLVTLQKQNVIYFLVARMLFTQTVDVKVSITSELLDIAKQEYELCQAAGGYQVSPLFDTDYDYSQFTVRGHYTRSDELGRYFKTMMWFGTAPYAFEKDGNFVYDNIYRALLISYTTFSESDSNCDAELWSKIYQPTTQYVGASDDVNVFDMNGLRLSVYGNSDNPDVFNDGDYQNKLTDAVKALPSPQIEATLDILSTPTGKQFRFMGQRYVLDSEIVQKLIDNRLRPIPSSLDVMGVLGSNTAKELLFNVYKPQDTWAEYTDKYNTLSSKVSALTSEYWKTNLYTGWLWALQDVTTEYDQSSGMPFFMTTDAWKYKSLNTALGSYTELKHDSVLYAKQAVAEGGGPQAVANQHYVEPNLALYSKLLYLTENTISVLQSSGLQNDKITEAEESYKKMLKLLMDCSVKELQNEPLNDEERKQLLWIGSTMENIMLNLQLGIAEDMGSVPGDISDMLVTDISTNLSNYLSLGTGYFDDIYVVAPVDGKLYLTRGEVYSFYEFTATERLTDEDWWALNGIITVHSDYGDYMDLGDPSASRPNQPIWIKHFKSDTNGVKIKELEVDWDNLSE
jgi:hypothetical protein